jgi:hypothetical protein
MNFCDEGRVSQVAPFLRQEQQDFQETKHEGVSFRLRQRRKGAHVGLMKSLGVFVTRFLCVI